MAYQEFEIAESLRPFVKVIWSMDTESGEPTDFSMRILPDSCVELVIHYQVPLSTTFSNGSFSLQPKSFVVSQMKSFIEIAPTGQVGFISIRFTARGAYHFFEMPMKEIADQVVDLEDIWIPHGKEVQSRIAEATSGGERSQIIQYFLMLQLRQNGNFDKAVDYSLDQLYSSGGQITIDQLATKTGLSNRQLVRRFDQKIGMPPKEFSRIIRFINATHLLKSGQKSIYDISYSCGYYDHAHFFHDFKRFSGLNPGQFQERSDVFL